MTSCTLRLPEANHVSVSWQSSEIYEGVRFCIRRMSLGQRIELTKRVYDLTRRNEFLRGGGSVDQLEAGLADLLAKRLYLEWGLIEIQGFAIDGLPATPESLIEKGPEELAEEIASSILADMQLTDEETKNS